MRITQTTLHQIDAALEKLSGSPADATGQLARTALERARQQALRALAEPLHTSTALDHADEMALSLVLTAIESAATAAPPPPPASAPEGALKGILGGDQYEDLDPRWISSLLEYLVSKPVPFPNATPQIVTSGVPDTVRLGLVGDWGTGGAVAQQVLRVLMDQSPHYTVHLGDVYYSGTPEQEKERFVDLWRAGSLGSFALNSNHEMYSGGKGYFDVALAHPKFALQGGTSYFALVTPSWLVLGLDTAYADHSFLYQKGSLSDAQADFIRATATQYSDRHILLLSHHQGIDNSSKRNAPLWSQVMNTLPRKPDLWFWGHIHEPAVHSTDAPADGVYCRCAGHGGVPYKPLSLGKLIWTEDRHGWDSEERRRAPNGCIIIELEADGWTERWYDERGALIGRPSQKYPCAVRLAGLT